MSSKTQLVRVVVGCANRKKRPPACGLRLGAYPPDIEERAARWTERIGSPQTNQMPARDLYMGEHWSVVKGLSSTADSTGIAIEIWVVSAGYGLISVESPLEPYSATFSPGSEDSVAIGVSGEQRSAANQYWWKQLTGASSEPDAETRDLASLAHKDPSVPMIVALSKTYIQAIHDDLVSASIAMGDNQNLILVATGDPPVNLEHTQVPCDARLVNSLGGTRTALNVRVANLIIQNSRHHSFDFAKVRQVLQNHLDESGSVPTYGHRERKSDAAIRELIRDRLLDHDHSRSALLRVLRDEGLACEQKRFSRLFHEVTDEG